MNTTLERANKRIRRVRSKIKGTPEHPRIAVFRSNKYVSAQLIDDSKGITLAAFSSKDIEDRSGKSGTDLAFMVGEELAKAAKKKKLEKVVFDKRSYKYHGVVKALADGARKGGLVF